MNKNNIAIAAGPNLLIERRSGKDRRKKKFSLFRRPFASRRRRTLRRQSDLKDFVLLDYYNPKLFYLATLILLLSVVDALLTLWLIDGGAEELNPAMVYFLDRGPNVFMAAKYLITAISVIITVLLHYICIQRTRFQFANLLNYFAGCFAAVIVWEFILLIRYMR